MEEIVIKRSLGILFGIPLRQDGAAESGLKQPDRIAQLSLENFRKNQKRGMSRILDLKVHMVAARGIAQRVRGQGPALVIAKQVNPHLRRVMDGIFAKPDRVALAGDDPQIPDADVM